MPDIAALKSAWPKFGTTAQKLAEVNKRTLPGPDGDIEVAKVNAYLKQRNKQQHLELFAAFAQTEPVRERLGMPPVSQAVKSANHLLLLLAERTLQTSKPEMKVRIEKLLNDVAADAGSPLEQRDVEAIMGLGATSVSWWHAHGFGGPISAYDLIEAGLA